MKPTLHLRERRWLRRGLGAAGVVFYCAHASQHLQAGHPEHLLWVCHLGALAVGVGLIAGWPGGVSTGLLWLTVGVPMWVYDLITGGEFLPTSTLTHVGGFLLGLFGLKAVGLPKGAWWKAGAAIVPLFLVCRWITPAPSNVNLAFSIWPGWERYFPSHPVYAVAVFVFCLGVFAVAEVVLRKVGFERAGGDG